VELLIKFRQVSKYINRGPARAQSWPGPAQ